MPDILLKLQRAYRDNPDNAVNLLPELFQEIEQGNIIEKTNLETPGNPCEICGIKKALRCIKHDTICSKKKSFEEHFVEDRLKFI